MRENVNTIELLPTRISLLLPLPLGVHVVGETEVVLKVLVYAVPPPMDTLLTA